MEQQLEEIISWLEAGTAADYQAGVLVLQKHCRNRSLISLLLKKESAANREKLHYELVEIGCGGRLEDVSEVLNHLAQAVQGAVPLVQQIAQVLTGQDFPAHPEPEHVPDGLRSQADELTQLMSKVYNQRCQFSNSLIDLSAAEGPRVVGEILSLEQQYNALAQKRRNLLAGEPTTAPAEQPAPETPAPGTDEPGTPAPDRAELVLKRNALRSNLSKARKKAEESKTAEKRSEYAQKAAKLQVELDQVEVQLKA